MALPQFQTDDKALSLMQNAWATALNPLLSQPLNSGVLLSNVSLGSGSNTINHRLGRKLSGWIITRIRAASVIYDTQDLNSQPSKTLILNSSAPVVVDLLVF